MLSAVAASIGQLVQTEVSPAQISESLAPKSVDAVRAHLEKFAARHNTTARTLSLSQRRAAMSELEAGGLLNFKNAISEVADTFGVARSTAYTYLPRESAKIEKVS